MCIDVSDGKGPSRMTARPVILFILCCPIVAVAALCFADFGMTFGGAASGLVSPSRAIAGTAGGRMLLWENGSFTPLFGRTLGQGTLRDGCLGAFRVLYTPQKGPVAGKRMTILYLTFIKMESP